MLGDLARVFPHKSLSKLINYGYAERVVAAVTGLADAGNPRVGFHDDMQPVSPMIDADDGGRNGVDFHRALTFFHVRAK